MKAFYFLILCVLIRSLKAETSSKLNSCDQQLSESESCNQWKEQSLETFFKQVLANDESIKIALDICAKNFIINLNTLLKCTFEQLINDLKFPFGIAKDIEPYLESVAFPKLSKIMTELIEQKQEINMTLEQLLTNKKGLEEQNQKLQEELNQVQQDLEKTNITINTLNNSIAQIYKFENQNVNILSQNYQLLSQLLINITESLENALKLMPWSYKIIKESTILSNRRNQQAKISKLLNDWMPKNIKQTNLLFRASRDGWRSTDFHRLCDNQGPTLVIVYANEKIFGGYNAKYWNNNGQWMQDDQGFLFSLDSEQKFIITINSQYAYFNGNDYSAVFGVNNGKGNDLSISSNANSNFNSCSQLGNVYGSHNSGSLAGDTNFQVVDYEVYTFKFQK